MRAHGSSIPANGNSKIRSTVDRNVDVSEYALIYNVAPTTLNQRVQALDKPDASFGTKGCKFPQGFYCASDVPTVTRLLRVSPFPIRVLVTDLPKVTISLQALPASVT